MAPGSRRRSTPSIRSTPANLEGTARAETRIRSRRTTSSNPRRVTRNNSTASDNMVSETQTHTINSVRTSNLEPVTGNITDNVARETQSHATTSLHSPSSSPSRIVGSGNGSPINFEQSPSTDQSNGPPSTNSSNGPVDFDGSIPSVKTRGVTRGLGTDRIVATVGRIPITFSSEEGKPICGNASRLANECGCIVREFAPMKVKSWTKIEPSERKALFHLLLNKFDIDLSLEHVIRYLDHTMGRSFSNYRSNTLHKEFKSYNTVDQAKQHPHPDVSQEDWVWLCDYFNSPDYKKRSEKNTENRANLEYNHRGGSCSFLRHAEKKRKSTGEEVGRIQLFYSTHYNIKNGWVNAEAESKYKKMLELQQQNELEESISLTEDDICESVLGKKSGYVKGLGYGPRPKHYKPSTTSADKEKEKLLETIKEQAEQIKNLQSREYNQENRLKRLEEIMLNQNGGNLPQSSQPSSNATEHN